MPTGRKKCSMRDIEAIIMNAEGGSLVPGDGRTADLPPARGAIAAAAVRMSHSEDEIVNEAAVGDGPVEAAFKALERATGVDLALNCNFEVRSVTMGEDAQGEVTVTVEYNGHSYRGNGVSTDIVEAGSAGLPRGHQPDLPAKTMTQRRSRTRKLLSRSRTI